MGDEIENGERGSKVKAGRKGCGKGIRQKAKAIRGKEREDQQERIRLHQPRSLLPAPWCI